MSDPFIEVEDSEFNIFDDNFEDNKIVFNFGGGDQDQDQDQDQKQSARQWMSSDMDNEIDNELKNENENENENKSENENENENKNENENENKVDNKLDNEMDNELDNKVDNALDNKLDNEIDNKIDNQIDNKVNVETDVDTDVDVSVDLALDALPDDGDWIDLDDVKVDGDFLAVENGTLEYDPGDDIEVEGNLSGVVNQLAFDLDQTNHLSDQDWVSDPEVYNSGNDFDIDTKVEGGDVKVDEGYGDIEIDDPSEDGSISAALEASADGLANIEAFNMNISLGANTLYNGANLSVVGGDSTSTFDDDAAV